MAVNLQIGAGASVTGTWFRSEPAKSVDYPIRLVFVGHGWTAGNVIIEELVGGQPGNGSGSPYPPQSDTGTVLTLATVPFGSGDLTISAPVDYIRARTDANVVGTVDTFLTMNS